MSLKCFSSIKRFTRKYFIYGHKYRRPFFAALIFKPKNKKNKVAVSFHCSRRANSTENRSAAAAGNFQFLLFLLYYSQLYLNKNFAAKRTQYAVKTHTHTHTVTTQMFNALRFRWTGHLPAAILYAPSASVWLRTLLVQQP